MGDSPEDQERIDTLKAARDYVWKSFDLQFKQRNEFLRFYTGILLPIYAAYGVVIKESFYGYGTLVALFALVTTALFFVLDKRVKGFMADYREFMIADEAKMAEILHDDTVRLFAKSWARPGVTYSGAYRMFFGVNVAVAVLFAAYCLCGYYRDS